jgi:hypothetical protein
MAILENTNLYFSLFIVHFSFKQGRSKSLANPHQIPFLNGSIEGATAKRSLKY